MVHDLFGLQGKIFERHRENKLPLYEFYLYSKEICEFFNEKFEVPYGKKSHIIKVPNKIKNSNRSKQVAFLNGCIITDGGIRKNKTLIFHMASKNFVEDLSYLIYGLYGFKAEVKEYIQGIHKSYQINFKKSEGHNILSDAGLAERLMR